jgi:hypothetical protein
VNLKAAIVSLFICLIGLDAFAEINPASFEKIFVDNQKSAVVSDNAKENAKKYRYIFIAGFLNEGFVGYFKDNIDFLKNLGVPKNQIHIVYPDSTAGVAENIDPLRDELQKLSNQGTQKLVLIAHSKGGAEALGLSIKYAAFVKEKVEYLFLIQAAIQGSGVADYIQGVGKPLDKQMSAWHRFVFEMTAETGQLLDKMINSGLGSLTHLQAQQLWELLLKKYGKPDETVAEKIYYIRASKNPSDMANIIVCTGHYLHTYYGKNDGLVELKDQLHSDIGTSLIVVEADHTDLTTNHLMSSMKKPIRQALTASIIESLD